jgi:dipeptidyl-peptidase-4
MMRTQALACLSAIFSCVSLIAASSASGGPDAQEPGSSNKQAAKTQPPAKSRLSREEELRKERMRARGDQGSTAAGTGLNVKTVNGDLVLSIDDGEPEQITMTEGAEIAPQLSNDGKLVAYVRDHALYAMNLDDRKERLLSPAPADGLSYGEAEFVAQEEMDRFDGFWISPDGKTIVYQETDERAIPVYPIVHQGDTEWSVENHRYPFAGKLNARVRLGIVPATGGETRWLSYLPDEGEQYLGRVHWVSPSHYLVEWLSRDHKKLTVVRTEAASGKTETLFTETAPDFINLHEDFRLIDADSGQFVWATEESGFKQLQLRDRDGKVVRNLTSGPGAVDKVLKVIPKLREVWYSAWVDTPLESHIFRVNFDGDPPVRLTKEPGMHDATVAGDGLTFEDRFSSLTQQTQTIRKNRQGTEAPDSDEDDKETARRPKRPNVVSMLSVLDDGQAKAQLVSFDSRDGVKLHGCYYPPRNLQPGQKAPLLVMVYGGPHVQTITNTYRMGMDPSVAAYTTKGIAVWKMDNRGSSRRGKAFEAAVFRNLGTLEVQDQVDGVRHVAKTFPEVDTSRVGITGGSYGGYMTLRALMLAPETFHVGVAFAPVTDWDGYDTCYTERYMETPATNPEGYRQSSVLTQVDKLQGKLLLVHGMIDENVHYRHTARLVQALMAAGKPFDLLAVPQGRHGFRRPADGAFARNRTVEFLTKHLAADSPANTPAEPNAAPAPKAQPH